MVESKSLKPNLPKRKKIDREQFTVGIGFGKVISMKEIEKHGLKLLKC